jgi:hypothetical protein
LVLCQPEILCDWYRNSGPVVSNEKQTFRWRSRYSEIVVLGHTECCEQSGYSGTSVLRITVNLCKFQKFWNPWFCVSQKFCVTGPEILDRLFRVKNRHFADVPDILESVFLGHTECCEQFGYSGTSVLRITVNLCKFQKFWNPWFCVSQKFCLTGPEILCDWSRNSGPVVSSQKQTFR